MRDGSDARERDLQRGERAIDLGANLFGPAGFAILPLSCLPGFIVGTYIDSGIAIICTVVVSLVVFTLLALKPRRVFLGRDGIERWRYLRRRLRYADINTVVYEEGSAPVMDGVASIYLRGREQVPRLSIHSKQGPVWRFRGRTEPDSDLLLLRDQLTEKLAEFRGIAPDQEVSLEQDGKLVTAWRDHLRAMRSGDLASYRSAPIDPDVLVRVALNPADPDYERVAALVALPRSIDEAARVRLKEIASDTTRPVVARALDAWLADDDAELEAALAAVAAPAPR